MSPAMNSGPRDDNSPTLPPTPALEIERKFLVDPAKIDVDLDRVPVKKIRQAYLVVSEDREERVRQKGEGDSAKFIHTIKSGGGLTREETNTPMTREEFEEAWGRHIGTAIEKVRYEIPHPDGFVIELDVYEGELAGLVVAEIEFPSVEASEAVELPGYFVRELTEDKRYKNKNLALHGKPE